MRFVINNVGDIEELLDSYPVPHDHFKTDQSIKFAKEFYALSLLLRSESTFSTFPYIVEYTDNQECHPDFIVETADRRFFIEVTEITEECVQQAYKKNDVIDYIKGEIDHTLAVRTAVERKNRKIDKYRGVTGINDSVLLLYWNNRVIFIHGATGDLLDMSQIESKFDQTYLVGVYNHEMKEEFVVIE